MACSAGCPTQDHASWGECLLSKNLHIDPVGFDRSLQNKGDKELAAYRDAVRQGIQPRSTRTPDINHAVRMSDRTGEAYQA